MRLDYVKGYFDVREYNAKKVRAERTMKGNDTTITFDVLYAGEELPPELAAYAKEYEKDGHVRYAVKFKVSSNTKWFGKTGGKVTKINRPDNADLDGKRFECCIDFRQLDGDASKMEARGYWVNGILIKEDNDMFADLNEEVEVEIEDDFDLKL